MVEWVDPSSRVSIVSTLAHIRAFLEHQTAGQLPISFVFPTPRNDLRYSLLRARQLYPRVNRGTILARSFCSDASSSTTLRSLSPYARSSIHPRLRRRTSRLPSVGGQGGSISLAFMQANSVVQPWPTLRTRWFLLLDTARISKYLSWIGLWGKPSAPLLMHS